MVTKEGGAIVGLEDLSWLHRKGYGNLAQASFVHLESYERHHLQADAAIGRHRYPPRYGPRV
jgi:hypothetical protein